MEKRMKMAIVVTMLVTVAYVVYLWVLGSVINLSVEKSVTFFSPAWLEIPLSFEVSPWWNLLLCPLTIMFVVYFYSQEMIIGKEPRGAKEETTGYKYYTRLHLFMVNAISISLGLGIMLLAAILSPLLTANAIGPLSMFVSGIMAWFAGYVVFSIWEEFAICFFTWNTFADDYSIEETSLTERYKVTLATFAKMGVFKTLPFMFGMTLGYICRFVLYEILVVTKSINISYKKIEETQNL